MAGFEFNGDDIVPCEGEVHLNGVRCREVRLNGILAMNGIWRPTPVLTVSATDIECEQVTITWVAPKDIGSGTITYDVYENGVFLANTAALSYIHTVRTSVPRTYTVQAVGSDCPTPVVGVASDLGNSEWKPNAPTSFLASNTRCSDITFTWLNPVEDGFPNATYDLYQGVTLLQAGVTTPHVMASVDVVSKAYHLQAKNICGLADSNTDNGQVASAPIAITNFAATDIECGQITFTWTNSLQTVSYDIFQGGTLIAAGAVSGHVYLSTTARTSVPYHVIANGYCGFTTASNTNNGVTRWAPLAPTGFSLTDNDPALLNQIRCTWTNPADVGSLPCTYNLVNAASGAVIIANITSGYLWTPGNNLTHNLRVDAINACGFASSNTNSGQAYTVAPPKTCTFTGSGTCTIGVGHTLADICILAGAGSGGCTEVSSDSGGGYSVDFSQSANAVANTASISVTIGGGGSPVGGDTYGNRGGNSTAIYSTGSILSTGGTVGSSDNGNYPGQGGSGISMCTLPAGSDGAKEDGQWGGRGAIGNGGGGGSYSAPGTGGTGAGGGAGYAPGYGASGAGGNGWCSVTTYGI